MANPQLQDGHLELANAIVESLARIRISGTEWQLLWVILRKTYGWRKKSDAIPLTQFHAMTGLSKPHIIRALKKLLGKKIVVAGRNGTGAATYGFNKDFEEWEPLPRKVIRRGATAAIRDTAMGGPAKKLREPFRNTNPAEQEDDRPGHPPKETYGLHVELTGEEYEKLARKFPAGTIGEVIDFFNLKIESKGVTQWRKDHKSDYATILFWERNGWIKAAFGGPGLSLSSSSRDIMGWAGRERDRLQKAGE